MVRPVPYCLRRAVHAVGRGSLTGALLGATLIALFGAGCASRPDSAAPIGIYKVGQPYQIDGTWYYPAEDDRYEEVGIASWYGSRFHGRPTANGETFDMNKVTAAHRTLPMPSMVEITNLENGRTIQARVNDRGPFSGNRIIDVSRRGAEMLGFVAQGTTEVRVRVLPEESRMVALQMQRQAAPADSTGVDAAPLEQVRTEDLAPPPAPTAAPSVARPATVIEAGEDRFFVQAGAFADHANASRLRDRVSALAPAEVVAAPELGRVLYKVRLGPAQSREEADELLYRLAQSGIADARIVMD